MRIRNVAFAAALALAAAGCGEDSCPTESADVMDVPSCSVAAGVPVTVQIPICARCNETSPTCDVDLSQLGFGIIQLDTRAEACTDGNSCPIPSCGVGQPDRQMVACTFTAPAADDYELLVFDAGSGSIVTAPFSTTGSATTCSGT